MKLSFDTAIFDLDGTLLDSMYVWKRVDEIFFERRGLPLSEEYGRALAGLSFSESADYTIDYYRLNEPKEAILREWTELAREEYAERVELKPGALAFLRFLKDMKVKLCVATALSEDLYKPCLEHLGIIDLFDALCSTDETGGRGKGKGEVYALACERVHSEIDRCVVFEDVLEGIRGAKHIGMRAVCVRDKANAHDHEAIAQLADRLIDDYYDLTGNVRCLIFTARCEGDPARAAGEARESDLVLCADGGWKIADSIGVRADITIGDFDSSEAPAAGNILRHPVEKDDTDTMLCAKYALELGIRDITIVGGLGGRIDHTMANLQTLQFLARRGARCRLSDGRTEALCVHNDSVSVEASPGKLSVFAVGGPAEGVSIRGAKYEAEDILLTPDMPMGMGNDFRAASAEIGVRRGTLLVIRDLARECE